MDVAGENIAKPGSKTDEVSMSWPEPVSLRDLQRRRRRRRRGAYCFMDAVLRTTRVHRALITILTARYACIQLRSVGAAWDVLLLISTIVKVTGPETNKKCSIWVDKTRYDRNIWSEKLTIDEFNCSVKYFKSKMKRRATYFTLIVK